MLSKLVLPLLFIMVTFWVEPSSLTSNSRLTSPSIPAF
nr:MAG TPA: hypothetical protein [Inoviridae sp.]